jgi:hypothetical protein
MTMPTETEHAEDRYSAVREAEYNLAESLVEADELLTEILEEGRQRAALSETIWFKANVGWSESEIADQLRRMASVLRLKSIAGSAEDRTATAQEAEAAAKALDSEGVKIGDAIAKLQAKLGGLERDKRLSQKRSEEQREAVWQLMRLCPAHIAAAVREKVGILDATIGQAIANGEIRQNELQCCLDPSRFQSQRDPQRKYLEGLRRSFPAAVMAGESGGFMRYSLSPEWPTIRSRIENELSALAAKLETLRTEYAAKIEQAELPLSYYCN